MLQFVEGNQFFPPRKSASLHVKNKSSSVFSNGHDLQPKIWVTSFSCWEGGSPEKGKLFTFSWNQRLQGWIPSALLPAGLRVLLLLWPPVLGSLQVTACAAAWSVGPAALMLTSSSHHFQSLWTAAHAAVGQSTPAILIPLWPVGKHLLSFMTRSWRKYSPVRGLGPPKGWPNQGVVQYTEYRPDAHPWWLFFLKDQTSFSLRAHLSLRICSLSNTSLHIYTPAHLIPALYPFPLTPNLIRGVIKISFQGYHTHWGSCFSTKRCDIWEHCLHQHMEEL